MKITAKMVVAKTGVTQIEAGGFLKVMASIGSATVVGKEDRPVDPKNPAHKSKGRKSVIYNVNGSVGEKFSDADKPAKKTNAKRNRKPAKPATTEGNADSAGDGATAGAPADPATV
jgi:hypothetical protein